MFVRSCLVLAVFFGSSAGFAAPKVDQVRTQVLKLLNQKQNKVRASILQHRAESCFEISGICVEREEDLQTNRYVFTAKDVLSVTAIGEGSSSAPCKTETCSGSDEETDEFVVLISSENRARWGYSPTVVVLEFAFVKESSAETGKVKYKQRLNLTNR